SEGSALEALRRALRTVGEPVRDRVEATVAASLAHGNATRAIRDPSHPDHARNLEHRRRLRRRKRCEGVKLTYPDRGRPCRAFAVAGTRYCFAHDPERREQVGRILAGARARVP